MLFTYPGLWILPKFYSCILYIRESCVLILVAQFMYIIRKRIQLPPEKAMFLFVNKVLPATR